MLVLLSALVPEHLPDPVEGVLLLSQPGSTSEALQKLSGQGLGRLQLQQEKRRQRAGHGWNLQSPVGLQSPLNVAVDVEPGDHNEWLLQLLLVPLPDPAEDLLVCMQLGQTEQGAAAAAALLKEAVPDFQMAVTSSEIAGHPPQDSMLIDLCRNYLTCPAHGATADRIARYCSAESNQIPGRSWHAHKHTHTKHKRLRLWPNCLRLLFDAKVQHFCP